MQALPSDVVALILPTLHTVDCFSMRAVCRDWRDKIPVKELHHRRLRVRRRWRLCLTTLMPDIVTFLTLPTLPYTGYMSCDVAQFIQVFTEVADLPSIICSHLERASTQQLHIACFMLRYALDIHRCVNFEQTGRDVAVYRLTRVRAEKLCLPLCLRDHVGFDKRRVRGLSTTMQLVLVLLVGMLEGFQSVENC